MNVGLEKVKKAQPPFLGDALLVPSCINNKSIGGLE